MSNLNINLGHRLKINKLIKNYKKENGLLDDNQSIDKNDLNSIKQNDCIINNENIDSKSSNPLSINNENIDSNQNDGVKKHTKIQYEELKFDDDNIDKKLY